jgi:hypothetical protein
MEDWNAHCIEFLHVSWFEQHTHTESARWLHLAISAHNCLALVVLGDIDELIAFSTSLTAANIQFLYRGDYFSFAPTVANGCTLWLKFNEGSGTTAADSCQQIAANTAVWAGTPIWRANNVTPKCLAGYHSSWKVVLPVAAVRVGAGATVTVQMVDQAGVVMSTYDTPPGASKVGLAQVGGTGSTLPVGFTQFSFSDGEVSMSMTSNKIESVTFALNDWGGTGRPTAITSPTLTWYAPDVSSLQILTVYSAPITLTPTFTLNVYTYTAASVSWGSTSIQVQASFSKLASVRVNGGLDTGLTSGGAQTLALNQGANLIEITSNEGTDGVFVYQISITRLPPDVTDILLLSTPSLSSSPSFSAGDFTPRTAVVSGTLLQLRLTVKFSVPGSVSATVNGLPFTGSILNNTPFDVSPLLSGGGANAIVVSSNQDGGSWSYSLSTGCPAPLYCAKTGLGATCEYKCEYCTGTTFRSVCLLGRPACCGTQGCAC